MAGKVTNRGNRATCVPVRKSKKARKHPDKTLVEIVRGNTAWQARIAKKSDTV